MNRNQNETREPKNNTKRNDITQSPTEKLYLDEFIEKIVRKVYIKEGKADKTFIKSKTDEVCKRLSANYERYRPSGDMFAMVLDCVDFKIADEISRSNHYKSGAFITMVRQAMNKGYNRHNSSMSDKDIDKSLKAIREATVDKYNNPVFKTKAHPKKRK